MGKNCDNKIPVFYDNNCNENNILTIKKVLLYENGKCYDDKGNFLGYGKIINGNLLIENSYGRKHSDI